MLDRKTTASVSRSSKTKGPRNVLRNLILAATVLVYGDWLLHGILHLLHIPFGILELLIDHFYVEVMGLSHRGAEIATAYTVFALAAFAAIRLLRLARNACRDATAKLRKHFRETRESALLANLAHYRPYLTAGLLFVTAGYFFLF